MRWHLVRLHASYTLMQALSCLQVAIARGVHAAHRATLLRDRGAQCCQALPQVERARALRGDLPVYNRRHTPQRRTCTSEVMV